MKYAPQRRKKRDVSVMREDAYRFGWRWDGLSESR
jgi:hypothetical protein